jgi:hypothetical protein
MMTPRRTTPRAVYRLNRSQLVNDSACLAQKFPKLKSLSVDLEYFDSRGVTKNGGMNFKANIEHAKSLFCFNCVNGDCIGGDFDLSEELLSAVSGKRKLLKGEMRCLGARQSKGADLGPCQAILRYRLSLGY